MAEQLDYSEHSRHSEASTSEAPPSTRSETEREDMKTPVWKKYTRYLESDQSQRRLVDATKIRKPEMLAEALSSVYFGSESGAERYYRQVLRRAAGQKDNRAPNPDQDNNEKDPNTSWLLGFDMEWLEKDENGDFPVDEMLEELHKNFVDPHFELIHAIAILNSRTALKAALQKYNDSKQRCLIPFPMNFGILTIYKEQIHAAIIKLLEDERTVPPTDVQNGGFLQKEEYIMAAEIKKDYEQIDELVFKHVLRVIKACEDRMLSQKREEMNEIVREAFEHLPNKEELEQEVTPIEEEPEFDEDQGYFYDDYSKVPGGVSQLGPQGGAGEDDDADGPVFGESLSRQRQLAAEAAEKRLQDGGIDADGTALATVREHGEFTGRLETLPPEDDDDAEGGDAEPADGAKTNGVQFTTPRQDDVRPPSLDFEEDDGEGEHDFGKYSVPPPQRRALRADRDDGDTKTLAPKVKPTKRQRRAQEMEQLADAKSESELEEARVVLQMLRVKTEIERVLYKPKEWKTPDGVKHTYPDEQRAKDLESAISDCKYFLFEAKCAIVAAKEIRSKRRKNERKTNDVTAHEPVSDTQWRYYQEQQLKQRQARLEAAQRRQRMRDKKWTDRNNWNMDESTVKSYKRALANHNDLNSYIAHLRPSVEELYTSLAAAEGRMEALMKTKRMEKKMLGAVHSMSRAGVTTNRPGLTMNREVNRPGLTMDRNTLSEVRRYQNPPQVLHRIVKSLLLLLGNDEKATQNWEVCKTLLNPNGSKNKPGLNTRIQSFKVPSVNMEIAARAIEILQPKQPPEKRSKRAVIPDPPKAIDFRLALQTGPAAASYFVWTMKTLEQIKEAFKATKDYESFEQIPAANVERQLVIFAHQKAQRPVPSLTSQEQQQQQVRRSRVPAYQQPPYVSGRDDPPPMTYAKAANRHRVSANFDDEYDDEEEAY